MPFKLTVEMVDAMGGAESAMFRERFPELCARALLAARDRADELLGLVEMSAFRSSMPCFVEGGETPLAQLRERLMVGRPDAKVRTRVEQLIALSYRSTRTRAYDEFQWWSNGIHA